MCVIDAMFLLGLSFYLFIYSFFLGTITCAGLAVDWVGNNLFWTDQRLQTINVIRLDKKESWKVLPVNTTHPKAIVVDPLEGYI